MSSNSKYPRVPMVGIGLMVLALCLYRFFDMSVLVAAPLFSLGSAIAGISMLIGHAGYSATARLIAGWSFIVLSVLPILLVILCISSWDLP